MKTLLQQNSYLLRTCLLICFYGLKSVVGSGPTFPQLALILRPLTYLLGLRCLFFADFLFFFCLESHCSWIFRSKFLVQIYNESRLYNLCCKGTLREGLCCCLVEEKQLWMGEKICSSVRVCFEQHRLVLLVQLLCHRTLTGGGMKAQKAVKMVESVPISFFIHVWASTAWCFITMGQDIQPYDQVHLGNRFTSGLCCLWVDAE